MWGDSAFYSETTASTSSSTSWRRAVREGGGNLLHSVVLVVAVMSCYGKGTPINATKSRDDSVTVLVDKERITTVTAQLIRVRELCHQIHTMVRPMGKHIFAPK